MAQVGPRGTHWGEDETVFLIQQLKDFNILRCLDGRKHRNGEVFTKVARELENAGFCRTPEQIRVKWKRMKQLYVKAKKDDADAACPYFHLFDDLLGRQSQSPSPAYGLDVGFGASFSGTWTRRSAKSDVAERGDSLLREIRPAPSNLKADVWQYFGFYDVPDGSRLDKSHCICKVCRCKIKYLGNTSNMRSHVTRFHLAEAAGRRRDTTSDATNADPTTLEDAIKSEPEDPNDDPEERPDAEEPAVRMEETVESSRLTPSPSYVDASPPASQRSPATDSFELLNERPRPRGRWSEVERFIASMERIQSVLVEQLRQSQERQERLVNTLLQSNQSMVAALLQGIQSLRPQPPDHPPPHVKEEEEELWITQEGDYLVEPGLTRAPLGAAASVKNEDHEEKPPECSQRPHIVSEPPRQTL
ncbi:zinc finger protein with KRAB and SCAN domains 2-like isoform X1 [Entelurus aequoreus]|uniref:zinc finger protein with KRAB and SCAN domains 2-like isoform X1 n=1 Tax=Entelurus aequoreus TaxID=161455 RepID=UPI002B1D23DD|nr:zinc finger protein with KRAB and SCAN domains 2-like isoform X1 [Entelurus aequoreus]XP_061880719.1 zinc finger protein with KRAB and SCAN domains 2-like isoform X1 [Entelurus aequoreus]